MSREEVDRALARLGAEHDAMESALFALQDHAGRRLLEGAGLTGVTRYRWSAAEQRIALVWSYFQTYQETLRAARRLRERGGRRPGQTVLAELSRLLEGEGVTVAGGADDGRAGSAGAPRLSEEISLARLVERMNGWYAEVLEVVTAADAVWSALPSRIDLLAAEARRVRAQADGMGARPGEHPVGDALGKLTADLEELRSAVRGDPLAFFVPGARLTPEPGVTARVSPHPGGHADTTRFDRCARELEDQRREVEAMLRLREDSEDRLAAVGEVLGRADGELAEARRVRGEVLAKITGSGVPVVPGPPVALYDRLELAGRYRRGGQWLRLAPLLDGLEQEADDELRRARGALEEVRRPMALRGELRGRLDAYHAKVGMKGRAEDPELAQAYQHARRLLWSAPCDLRAAEWAVRRYQQLIDEVLAGASGSEPDAARHGGSRT